MEELRSELGYYPTWLPTDPVEVGDIGVFSRGVFRKAARLAALGIDFETRTAPTKNNFKKSRGIQFVLGSEFRAESSVVDVTTRIRVGSKKAYNWAFGALGCRLVEFDDHLQVEAAILERARAGVWKKEWLVVSEVQLVDRLNLLVATTKDMEGYIVAKGTISSPGDALLAEEIACHFDANDTFVVQNARNTRPLFGLRALRGLYKNKIVPVHGGSVEPRQAALDKVSDAQMFED